MSGKPVTRCILQGIHLVTLGDDNRFAHIVKEMLRLVYDVLVLQLLTGSRQVGQIVFTNRAGVCLHLVIILFVADMCYRRTEVVYQQVISAGFCTDVSIDVIAPFVLSLMLEITFTHHPSAFRVCQNHAHHIRALVFGMLQTLVIKATRHVLDLLVHVNAEVVTGVRVAQFAMLASSQQHQKQ